MNFRFLWRYRYLRFARVLLTIPLWCTAHCVINQSPERERICSHLSQGRFHWPPVVKFQAWWNAGRFVFSWGKSLFHTVSWRIIYVVSLERSNIFANLETQICYHGPAVKNRWQQCHPWGHMIVTMRRKYFCKTGSFNSTRYCLDSCGPGSVVGIATAYGLDGPGIESRWGEIFRTSPDRPWGTPSLLYNGYRVFPGGKVLPGRDADPSPHSSAEV